ncbi:MAG: T9SS type A sorting domain-containing protein [Fimbriimonadaceae bacterium]|nr:T9SS type A sorting domain-containing protein [Chitinophagales bacterium]
MKNCILLLILFVHAVNIYSQAGALDTTYGDGGKVVTSIGPNYEGILASALQADGKLVTAGYSNTGTIFEYQIDFALVRYDTDGSTDITFGDDGKVVTDLGYIDDAILGMAIDIEGKIIAVGSHYTMGDFTHDIAIARYNEDGTLDDTFSDDGILIYPVGIGEDEAYNIIIQPDGKYIVCGYALTDDFSTDFVLIRLHSDGSPDDSFGDDGIVTTSIGSGIDKALSITLQDDGKIIAAGKSYNGSNYDIALVRYNDDGSLDTSFGDDGKITTAIGTSDDDAFQVLIQSDNKIVVGGSSIYSAYSYEFVLIRYNEDGSLDDSFNADGIFTYSFGSSDRAFSISIQTDGKLLAAGKSYNGYDNDFALIRLNTDGSFDNSFDSDGIVTTDFGIYHDEAFTMQIQSDNKIIVAGRTYVDDDDFAVARYLNSACNYPELAEIGSSQDTICIGDHITLNITSGVLNDATEWVWYTGSCGDTEAGTGTSLEINPDETTTYYVRGEGGCITGGICSAHTIHVIHIDTSITYADNTLHANGIGSYQWINCESGEEITEATSQDFIPLMSGTYAVVISADGCSDTSSCYAITAVAISNNVLNTNIHIYPNPTAGILFIDNPLTDQSIEVIIKDVTGKLIYQVQHNGQKEIPIDLSAKPKGVYFLTIHSSGDIRIIQFAIQ